MKLDELKANMMSGIITVASAKSGRILIHNAAKLSGVLLELNVTGITPKIKLPAEGTFSVPYLYCYASEEEYKRLKGAKE